MDKEWNWLIVALLCFLVTPTSVMADEAALRKVLQSHLSGKKIGSLKQTPYMGLYEVVVEDEILYTDEKGTYLFFGHIVDPKTRQSLTSLRQQGIRDAKRVSFDSLPLDQAIKAIKGNGKRKVAIFTDPNCPYCKLLEKELVKVTDVTIYTLLYPVLNGSELTARAIWCSPDKLKAWNDFMLQDINPTGKECEAPLARLLQEGKKHNISGTPALIFADGSIAPGFISADKIEEKLNSSQKK